ncbi:hypothetical protein LOD99_15188 [Oopsacas minuta]|uniref:Uncharacterized protein n=1 Tax=Oopsacas minuta TaxID=111878 RepID=A0AAV7KC87_9METZ|nr:hypothetical protein LOD99_15188 [Oopsacas minuta]
MDLGIKLSLNEHAGEHEILKDHDILALESYFHSSKITAPMFSSNALCCYLKLMSSHANLIQTAAFIFRNFKNPPSDWLWQPELCLTVPEHSLIMPSDDLSINPGFTCLFSFAIKKMYMLYLRFLPLKQDHGPILDLIFIYDYKLNRIDMKTYGISTPGNFDLIGSSIRHILSKVNSNISETDDAECSLLLAVKEISKHLEI